MADLDLRLPTRRSPICDRALVDALADGVAGACAETGLVDQRTIIEWRAVRRQAQVEIGHIDMFARSN